MCCHRFSEKFEKKKEDINDGQFCDAKKASLAKGFAFLFIFSSKNFFFNYKECIP